MIALGLSLFGGCAWSNHSRGVPECDGKAMEPGDSCRTVGRGGGSTRTYEETKRSLADSVPVDRALVFGGAAVFVVTVVAVRATRRREDREVREAA